MTWHTVRPYPLGAARQLALVAAVLATVAVGQEPELRGGDSIIHDQPQAWESGPPAAPSTGGGWSEGVDGAFVADGAWIEPGGSCNAFTTVADGTLHGAGVEACGARGPCPTWSWRAEALALWRSAPRSRPLFSDVVDGEIGRTALDANQLESDPLAAPRLSLLRDDGCGRIWEANYLWAGNFYAQRGLPFVEDGYATSPPSIYGNEWGPDTGTSLNSAAATLTANLQTAELNIRERFLHDVAQFLIGFRWLQWNESLQMEDSFNNRSESLAGSDFYRTDCFNNLYGGQIGIDARLLGSQTGYRVDGLVKAGAFYNDATQRSSYAYTDSASSDYSASNRVGSPDGAAFVGEVGMTAVIPVHCNLDFRVGYFGLWIESIAQPANQLSGQDLAQGGSDAGSLDLTGGVVVQGLSLGLEGRW